MPSTIAPFAPSELSITANLGYSLLQILMADDVLPGSNLSYQLAKLIYLFLPLG